MPPLIINGVDFDALFDAARTRVLLSILRRIAAAKAGGRAVKYPNISSAAYLRQMKVREGLPTTPRRERKHVDEGTTGAP